MITISHSRTGDSTGGADEKHSKAIRALGPKTGDILALEFLNRMLEDHSDIADGLPNRYDTVSFRLIRMTSWKLSVRFTISQVQETTAGLGVPGTFRAPRLEFVRKHR